MFFLEWHKGLGFKSFGFDFGWSLGFAWDIPLGFFSGIRVLGLEMGLGVVST